MKINAIKNSCTGCSACAQVCPKNCIKMQLDGEGFYFPVIDKDSCISCGLCEKTCPALSKKPFQNERSTFYGWLKDDKLRDQSTSGGAFVALAQSVLDSGGNVYGASFDYETLTLRHRGVDEVGLDSIKKSKYIESFMGDTIKNIKEDLKSGKKVLFCGTPCEVSGVRSALKNNDENLILVDFFCHGVPSSKLFKESLKKRKGKITSIDFRPKQKGWSNKNIEVKTEVGDKVKVYSLPYNLDFFYEGFMTSNAFLRRSCYNCEYRETHYSDITIGDFWGYIYYDKSLNDEKGISLLVSNTLKGEKAISELKNFTYTQIDNQFSAYAYKKKNYTKYAKTRELFYQNYKKYGFEIAAKKTYMKGYFVKLLKYKIKKLLGR